MSDEIKVGDRFEMDGEEWTVDSVDTHPNWPINLRHGTRMGACSSEDIRKRGKRLPPSKPKQPEPTDGPWKFKMTGEVYRFSGERYMSSVTGEPIGWVHDKATEGGGKYFPNKCFTDGTLEYVGEAETEKASGSIPPCQPPEAEGERDWTPWTPPKTLPNTGLTCGNNGCGVSDATVRVRYCSWAISGTKRAPEREVSCDACHLKDEAQFAEMTARHDENMRPEVQPPTRYDARTLLATPGLGSPSLICPVRGMRGPL